MTGQRAMTKRACNGNDAPMEIRANLVRLTSADGVALRAAGLEEGSTLGRVTYTRQSSSTAFFKILLQMRNVPAAKGIV